MKMADDIQQAPSGQSGRSMALSNMKKRLDMKDGDEHPMEHPATIGPVNDMYLAIRELSCFPFGNAFHHGRVALIENTQINRR
jgi:hypothetical protein